MATRLSKYNTRQYMARSDFEIQHKKNTDLTQVADHQHEFYELFYLVSGDICYVIDEKEYTVTPGDMLFICPGQEHKIQINNQNTTYERYVLWLDMGVLKKLSTGFTDLTKCLDATSKEYVSQVKVPQEYKQVLKTLLDNLSVETEVEEYGADIMQWSIISSLLVLINRFVDQTKKAESLGGAESKLVQQVVEYLDQHYAEDISLDGLSEAMFVSKYHLSHEFKDVMGMGVYHYLQKKRVTEAMSRLQRGDKPNVIYRKCGFSDYAGFFRAFKAEFGIAPSEVRVVY